MNNSTEKSKQILAKNLKVLLAQRGISRTKLSDDLDIKYTTIADWLKGRTYPRVGAIRKLADYFNVHTSDIVDEHIENMPESGGIVNIPVIGQIAGGQPILADEHIEGYVRDVKAGLPNGELFYIRIKGHSMEPTIPNGALVLIQSQPTVETGDIAAVLINDEATLKRVYKDGNQYVLQSENSSYAPIVLSSENQTRIIGKAIRVIINL